MTGTLRTGVVLAAAVLLTAPLVTSATAAGAAAPQPSTSFAGYQVSKPKTHVSTATTTFVIPMITCKKNFSGVGLSVLIDTIPNKHNITTYSGGAVAVGCDHRQPRYEAILVINGLNHDQRKLSLAVGDKVTFNVTTTKPKTKVAFDDTTSGAHKTLTGPGKVGSSVSIGDEVISTGHHHRLGLDPFTKTSFTNCTVNGKSLAAQHAIRYERKLGKTVQISVSPLRNGKNFSLTFHHS
jgi:hypothetical protein